MPARQLAAALGSADSVHARDPGRPPLVVSDVRVEGLLGSEPLRVLLQLRPALKPVLAGELELRVGETEGLAFGAARADTLLRLLAQLLEVEVGGHDRLLSVVPVVRIAGGKKRWSYQVNRG